MVLCHEVNQAASLEKAVGDSLEQIVSRLGFLPWVAPILGALILFLIAWLSIFVARRYLLRLLERWIRRTEFEWDDALLEQKVLKRASLFAPILVLYFGLSLVPFVPADLEATIGRICLALLVLTGLLTTNSVLSAVNQIYTRYPISRGRPIKGYLQIVAIFAWVLGLALMVAIVIDRSPLVFLTGIGAMTAVLLLIFRDTILSFVASIQIVSNDMVRIGDWIEMPKYGADGDVIDIALHTIKVQNFDKTITTIPTYKLIDDSFKNWRGMQQSGGRRIKRSLNIDMTTIRFLDESDIARFSRFALLKDYMSAKTTELEEYNRKHVTDPSVIANGRRLTNIGTFRAYVSAYLQQQPKIHTNEMTFLIRQLQPGPEGLPLEIYVFTTTTGWIAYEGIQADILDHILAIVPEFGLRVFQQPTGQDFANISTTRAG